MSPSVTVPIDSHQKVDEHVNGHSNGHANGHSTKNTPTEPLKKTGALDANFAFIESTPAIGREYSTANIVDDFLNAPNADELIRDIAITSKHEPLGQRLDRTP